MKFADFYEGQHITLGPVLVEKQAVIDFATQWDPQWFHTDEAAADDGPFSGLIASGWHTCCMAMRLVADQVLKDSESFASPGMEKLQWLQPVRPGDELRVRIAGFDRILVPASSSSPDTLLTVNYAASVTDRIKFLLAHRPGFVAPTLAARQLATLDHYTGGRVAVHYITGGSDEDQQRDGDFVDHDERYARTDEYLGLLRQVWTLDDPSPAKLQQRITTDRKMYNALIAKKKLQLE